MLDRLCPQPLALKPSGRPQVQLHPAGFIQIGTQELGKELVVAEPDPPVVEGDEKQVRQL